MGAARKKRSKERSRRAVAARIGQVDDTGTAGAGGTTGPGAVKPSVCVVFGLGAGSGEDVLRITVTKVSDVELFCATAPGAAGAFGRAPPKVLVIAVIEVSDVELSCATAPPAGAVDGTGLEVELLLARYVFNYILESDR